MFLEVVPVNNALKYVSLCCSCILRILHACLCALSIPTHVHMPQTLRRAEKLASEGAARHSEAVLHPFWRKRLDVQTCTKRPALLDLSSS
eukprot:261980-Pelagomonas_calceolata.AAC.4